MNNINKYLIDTSAARAMAKAAQKQAYEAFWYLLQVNKGKYKLPHYVSVALNRGDTLVLLKPYPEEEPMHEEVHLVDSAKCNIKFDIKLGTYVVTTKEENAFMGLFDSLQYARLEELLEIYDVIVNDWNARLDLIQKTEEDDKTNEVKINANGCGVEVTQKNKTGDNVVSVSF